MVGFMSESLNQQLHGYRRGHELLASSIILGRDDQDTVDRLSDISGSPSPGETFAPYLTAYPLPSNAFYVLSRTWQDLAAPRSGCVLTRSLFIPMQEWMSATSLRGYMARLVGFDRDASSVDTGPVVSQPEDLPGVRDARLGELVEALFLEARRPVVVFGIDNADLIAERLLMSLLPSMRRQFSLSTFCLGPRQVAGRYLDLCFAPVTARQRFSGFDGRRIDTVARPPRHRWTSPLVERLFTASRPSLVEPQALNTLDLGVSASEFDVRVALLWSELWDQSKVSPSATLALLDVLNSRNLLSKRIAYLRPMVLRAIDAAAVTERAPEALHFLDTLLAKFTEIPISLSVAMRAWRAARRVAAAQPAEALDYLLRDGDTRVPVASVLLAGVGDALDPVPAFADVEGGQQAVANRRLMQLSAASKGFAARIVGLVDVAPWRELVELAFSDLGSLNATEQNRLRRNAVRALTKPGHATIFRAVLAGADSQAVVRALKTIWRTTALEVREFHRPLLEAARDKTARDDLRNSIALLPETSASNELLAQSLTATASDFIWVCATPAVGQARAARVVAAALDTLDDHEIQTAFRDDRTVSIVLRCLQPHAAEASAQIARVILAGSGPVDEILHIGREILCHVQDSLRRELARMLVRRGLQGAGRPLESSVKELIETRLVDIPDVREFAVTPGNGPRRIDENLALLNCLCDPVRDELLGQMHKFSDQLVRIPAWALGDAGIRVWADMIRDSGRVSAQAQVAAAWTTLEYALRDTHGPVSPLVVASFPIVHEELRRGKEPPRPSGAFYFFDWDRCKVLQRDVVRAYMGSRWPPGDLLLSAYYARATKAVLKHVVRQWGGREYLAGIKYSIERCDEPMRSSLRDEVAGFENSESSWW